MGRRLCGRRWNCPESAAGPTPLYGCGIGILGGVEVQPGTLGVLFQQALAFKAAADTLADQLDQLLQLGFVRRLDATKSGWSIVAIHIDAIQKQEWSPCRQSGRLSRKAVIAQAAAFTFLNPHVYLDTVLLIGSVGAQHPAPLQWAFIAGACSASALWFAGLGFGARWLAPVFAKPRAWQVFDVVIALGMWGLASSLFLKIITR